jgi:hypothetical protein
MLKSVREFRSSVRKKRDTNGRKMKRPAKRSCGIGMVDSDAAAPFVFIHSRQLRKSVLHGIA